MRRSKKQEIVSRILVSSSVFILGSPIFMQALVSIPASAESISTTSSEETTNSSAPEETMLTADEMLPEQQKVEEVDEETVGTESEAIEAEEQATTAEEFAATKTESEEELEKNSSEATTDNTEATEEKMVALADNILWSGMWGTAPATLDIEGVLTVGAGTLTTTVDQVIPIAEVSSNMTIRKVVLTAPVVLPADVPGLFESTGHYGKVPSELDEIVNLHLLDTSQATTMNSMFYGFRGTSLDLSNFDSSGVINALGAGMNQFLANVRYLKEIRLGEKFSFVGWNNWPGNEYPVNLTNPSGMIGFSSSYYTGYWQNVGAGTVDAPYGDQVFLSKDLVMNYDGATMADTYVWQPRYIEGAPITVNYIDENGNELLPPNIMTGGNIGDSYTIVPEDIAGYTLKEVHGDESGIIKTTPQTVTYVYTPKIETTEESKIVARIIHYLYEDGSEAAPDHVDTIEFIRTVTINEATGDKTYGEWKPRNDDSMFEGVKSPEIENYSADTDYVEEVIDVSPEEEYHDIVVMYTPRLEAITETKEVTQTIHYVYEDGTEAVPDKRDTVTFTRNGMKNLATGELTYDDWQAKDDDTTFDEVISPEIDNYIADSEKIETVTGLTADDKDSEITVTYSAKTTTTTETIDVHQTIHYVYEDGTEAAPDNVDTVTFERTVTTNEATGDKTYGEWEAKDDDTTFDAVVSPEITNYTPDKTGVPEMVDLTAESKDSEVTVIYKANMVETTETKEVKQTIHYVYEDGTEAAPDNVDTVTFERTVTTNEATGDKTYGEWEAKDNDTTFDKVASPEIEHYTADKTIVEEITGLTEESKDSEVTVTYRANMVESTETKEVHQTIHYLYEDGTEAAPDNVDTVTFERTVTTNEATGDKTYGEWEAKDNDTTFDEVASPEIEHYTADKTTVEEVSGLTEDSKDNEVTVTYKPKMETTTESKEVNLTVHYVFSDGSKAADDYVDTVTFTRNATKNLATDVTTYDEWTATNNDTTFDEVNSPVITMYTPDKTSMEEVTSITADSKNIEVTVTYKQNPMASVEMKEVKRVIHYVYEDGTAAAVDKVDKVTFTRTVVQDFENDKVTYGDWLPKDNDTIFDAVTSPEIEHYTADKATVEEVTGLTAESKDSEVTVTYTPNMVESTETKEVKRTIHYLYEDGTEAVPDKVDTVTFTRTVTTNEATNDKTYGEWEAKDNDTTFDAVDSPTIDKYHADKDKVEEVTGLTAESKDSEVTVTYTPNMVESTETKEVNQTIHYVYEDGTEAAPDKVDTVSFTRTATTNEATGDKTYGEWQAKDNDTTFDEVTSPEIKNYTADKTTVEEVTGLTAEDKDSEVTVTYKKKTKLATESSATSGDPTKADNNKMPTIKTQAKASRSVTTKKTLPQTGEETNSMVLYSGAALVVAAILDIFIKRSSRKTKE
ncbi:mucin-binding protein [Enterococcus gallinarum]|uniref:LPXTG-domain-containing protein cell wall anchor domain protein n=1 Tax=Enterococcus gallinarum TaxID=1353 RepID=A0A376H1G8_ENTGA|nr:MucBP domain-containing protein [Enterococcus gallinarum]STD84617.1 LPXTG-domain-containing protein cell wall anchor domain protein [Enterococcus gallinarum]STD86475.1 LPXTG-domain-containing protein cell wall anchor domain protein [Enterococcus gallinarum]